MKWHPEVLNRRLNQVLAQVGPLLDQHGFYLAGGTALALYLGHRRSVDLDWFTAKSLADPLALGRRLQTAARALIPRQIDPGTLHGTMHGVRLTLLEYRYPLLRPLVRCPPLACSLASLDDLAAMKLAAVAQRGARKDFVDVHALAGRLTWERMLAGYRRKFGLQDLGHLLVALAYFDDAEREAMPRMLEKTTWRMVRRGITDWLSKTVQKRTRRR